MFHHVYDPSHSCFITSVSHQFYLSPCNMSHSLCFICQSHHLLHKVTVPSRPCLTMATSRRCYVPPNLPPVVNEVFTMFQSHPFYIRLFYCPTVCKFHQVNITIFCMFDHDSVTVCMFHKVFILSFLCHKMSISSVSMSHDFHALPVRQTASLFIFPLIPSISTSFCLCILHC